MLTNEILNILINSFIFVVFNQIPDLMNLFWFAFAGNKYFIFLFL